MKIKSNISVHNGFCYGVAFGCATCRCSLMICNAKDRQCASRRRKKLSHDSEMSVGIINDKTLIYAQHSNARQIPSHVNNSIYYQWLVSSLKLLPLFSQIKLDIYWIESNVHFHDINLQILILHKFKSICI